MRITVFDGLRGLFLVFMTVNHLNAVLHTTIGRLTPGALGFVENAHGFVLMSGLVVGLVYSKRLIRQGSAALDQAMWARMGVIFRWHMALVALFLAASLLLQAQVLEGYVVDPIGLPLASLALVGASEHMGILPMYLWFMAATPFVLRAFQRGDMVFVLAGSAALWLFAQSGAGQGLEARIATWFAAQGYATGFGLYFNIFGWQALFVAGLVIGWLLASDRLSLTWLNGRVAGAALAVFVALFLLDRVVNDGWLPATAQAQIAPFVHRGNYGIVHLVSTLVDAVLLTWLLSRGSASDLSAARQASTLLSRLLTFPPLVRLGQHSLQVFAAHIPLVYVIQTLAERGMIPLGAGSLIILASPSYLYAIASLHDVARRPGVKAQAAA